MIEVKASAEFKVCFDLMATCSDSFTVLLLAECGQCLFELLDTDHDRHLSLRESLRVKNSFAARDVNKDGSISKQACPLPSAFIIL